MVEIFKLFRIMSVDERRRLGFILFFSLICSVLELLNLQLLLDIVHRILGEENSSSFDFLIGIASTFSKKNAVSLIIVFAIILSAFVFSLRILTYLVLTRFAQGLRASFSLRLLRVYLAQCISSHSPINTSEKLSVIITEVDQLVAYVVQPLAVFAGQISVLFSVSVFVLLNLEPEFTLILLLLPGSYILFSFMVRKRVSVVGARRQSAALDRFSFGSMAFDLALELAAARKLNLFIERFDLKSKMLAKAIGDGIIFATFPKYFLEFFVFVAILTLGLVLENSSFAAGSGSFATVLGILLIATFRLLPSIQALYQSVSQFRFGVPALNKVYQVLTFSAVEDILFDKCYPSTPKSSKFTLVVTDLSVKIGNRFIVRDICFSVTSGQMYHLVGASGSGKSTLLKCLSGFREFSGSVYCTSQNNVEQRSFYLVPQKSQFGRGTIRELMTLFLCDASDEEIYRVFSVCDVTGFLEQMSLGLDSFVEDADSLFSGGQVQRLCLARALLHRPDVLLLDEGLSGVDSALEHLILERVRIFLPNLLLIFTSHRASSCSTDLIELQTSSDVS